MGRFSLEKDEDGHIFYAPFLKVLFCSIKFAFSWAYYEKGVIQSDKISLVLCIQASELPPVVPRSHVNITFWLNISDQMQIR